MYLYIDKLMFTMSSLLFRHIGSSNRYWRCVQDKCRDGTHQCKRAM